MMASAALREIASYTVNERANLDWLLHGLPRSSTEVQRRKSPTPARSQAR